MIWQNPRRFIRKTLLITGVISLLLSAVFIVLAVSWEPKKELIKAYDATLENDYNKKLRRIKIAIDKESSETAKFEKFQLLRQEIANTNNLFLYQDLHQETYDYLINYHIQSQQYNKAQELTEEWMHNQPNNLLGKYAHAKVLFHVDVDQGVQFVEQISDQFYDIAQVQIEAAKLYIKSGMSTRALNVVNQFKPFRRNKNKPSFMYYYADNDQPKFSQKSIIRIKKGEFKETQGSVSLAIPFQFNGLKKLRFDVDQVQAGTVLKNTSFIISNANEEYVLDWEPLHSIYKMDDTVVVTGKDPYLLFDLPEPLVESTAPLTLKASFNIEYKNQDPMDAFFIDSSSWQQNDSSQSVQWQLFGQMSYFADIEAESRFVLNIKNMAGLTFKSIFLKDQAGHLTQPQKLEGIEYSGTEYSIKDPTAKIVFDALPENSAHVLFLIQEEGTQ